MSKIRYILYFLFTALCWGGSFLGIRYSIEGFDPYWAAFFRPLVGFVFLVILFSRRKIQYHFSPESIFLGVVNMGIPWFFLFHAEMSVNPGIAAIINSTVPVFVTLFSFVLLRNESTSLDKWLGVLLGFVGVGVIFYPELNAKAWSESLSGMVEVILMAIFYAFGIMWARRVTKTVTPEVSLMQQFLGACGFLLIVCLLLHKPILSPGFSLRAVGAIVYLGIFSSALAMLLFMRIIRDKGSVQAAAITYPVPLVAILLDAFFLHKIIAVHQAIGAVMILLALFLINQGGIVRLVKSRFARNAV